MPARPSLVLRSMSDGLDVRYLQVLVALAEEGTFTDAAIRLGTGQPSVSRTCTSS